MTTIGIVHPGAMGATIAATCGAPVRWSAAGRSSATRERAREARLTDVGGLAALVECCDVIVSVCPPVAAVGRCDRADRLRRRVRRRQRDRPGDGALHRWSLRALRRRRHRRPSGACPRRTTMYLSGERAAEVAEWWSGSDLRAVVIDGGAGAASALKMAYAAWTKISSSLLLSVRALAPRPVSPRRQERSVDGSATFATAATSLPTR